MKNVIAAHLLKQPFLVLDGSLASELEKLGADLNDPLWSAKILIEAPELIRSVHDNYLSAGADIISTATYQASFAGFAKKEMDHRQARKLFDLSVDLAHEARLTFWAAPERQEGRQFPLIAASLGPYGASLADGSEYRGDYDLNMAELTAWHRPQVTALATNGSVDLLLFETIPSLTEAKAIIRLMGSFPEKPFIISFSVRDDQHIATGEGFGEVVREIAAVSALQAIGVNCTAPKNIGPLLQEAHTATNKPLMVYPNSGEYWNAQQHCWYGEGDLTAFSHMVQSWYRQGAQIIGGCCRTGPEHITEIRKALDQLTQIVTHGERP